MGRTVVIGAGVAGLAAAKRLRDAGHDVVVLEAETEIGGLCRTIRHDGCMFDLGPHFIHDTTARDIGILGSCVEAVLHEAVHIDGRFYSMPFGILSRVRYIPSLALATMRRLLSRRDGDEAGPRAATGSLEDRLRTTYGRAFYDEVMGPLIRKWLGADLASVSPILARRFDPPDPRVILFHLKVRLFRRHSDYFHQNRQYVFPVAGIAAVPGRLAAGIDVRLGAPVREVIATHGRIVEVRAGDLSFPCDAAVSTIPAETLAKSLRGVHDAAAQRLTTRGVIFVLLCFDRPRVTKHLWSWFPEPALPFYRVSELANLAPTKESARRDVALWTTLRANTAPPGHSSVVAEICASPDDPRWKNARDAAIVDEVVRGIRAVYGPAGDIVSARVVRAGGAYPTFRLDEEDAWSRPPNFGLANLVVAGRSAEHRYHMVEHAIASGRAAADALLAGPLSSRNPPC